MAEMIFLILEDPLLLAPAIVSVGLTALLVILVLPDIRYKHIKGFFELGFNRMNEVYNDRKLLSQVKKYTGTIKIRMSNIEKLELHFIDKSNIRRYLPFFNLYILLLISLVILAISFQPVYRILLSVPSTLLICLLISSTPFLVLDIWGRYNTELVRRKFANFVSVLNRWCAVKEDIIYAFHKSVDSGIGEPLRTYVRDTVIQAKKGLDIQEALELLMMKVDSSQFRDFILNIMQNIKHRGDLRKLLSNLEDEFYALEEEYSRRKISTYKDRITIYACMLAVLAVGYLFLKYNPNVTDFYLNTPTGKGLISLFSFLYFSAFVLSLRVSNFSH